MATSWRISTKLFDKTDITPVSDPIIGATVIKSYKGQKKFTFFNRGDSAGIINTFGYPSKEYPSIQDAIDINNKCAMWIASAYKGGTYGGVFVTARGSVPFVNGVKEKNFEDLSEVKCVETLGIADGTDTVENTLSSYKFINFDSIKITVNDSLLDASFTETSEGSGIYNITDTNTVLKEGSTYDTNNGEMVLKFTNSPAKGTDIEIAYNIDVSDTYLILYDKDMQSDDLAIQVKKDDDVEGFDISVFRYDFVEDDWSEVRNSPFLVGLKETSKDTYGDNIYIENIFNDEQTLFDAQVINADITDFVSDTSKVELKGGYRGDEVEGADLARVYDDLKDTAKYQIKFAFDGTASEEVVAKFELLRNGECKWTRFLYCGKNLSAEAIIADPSKVSCGINANRGMYCYVTNWGIHKDIYQGNNFMCSNMGLIAGRFVDTLNVGGGQPAWIDGDDGVGGTLGDSIVKLAQSTSETQLEQLDTLGFNPVVYDASYGPMVVGWRTRQVVRKSAYSYISQSSLADTIVDLVERNVLPLRIGKIIDETAFSAVRTGCETILRNYSRFLDDYVVICDSRNNSDDTKADQKLIVAIGVQFAGFAEKIMFTFSSFRQGVNVEEEILKG